MEKLNEKEINAARSIINIGLDKAAESLSFFMKEEITMNDLDLCLNKLENENETLLKLQTIVINQPVTRTISREKDIQNLDSK